jgi:two-component system LytT family response regulator
VGTNAIVRLPFVFSRGWSWFSRGLFSALSEYVVPASLAFAALVAIGHWLAPKGDAAPTHVSIADRGQTFRVPVEAIHWIQAEDNYVLIHTPARTYTARERISDFESRLDRTRFARVHRSAIVNLSLISAVKPLSHGDYEVVLSCGTSVRGSRSRRAVLDRLR